MRKPKQRKVSLADLAIAAMDEAAKDVVLRARKTKTPIVIWEDGKIKQIPASRFRLPPRRGKAKQAPPGQG